MRVAAGLGILALGIPLFPLTLSPVGFYGYWALLAAGILLTREDPRWRRGMLPALATLAALVVLTLLGTGVTIGTAAGPIASGGGLDSPLSWLGFVMLMTPATPAAVLLALGTGGRARVLARWAVEASGLTFVVALVGPAFVGGAPGVLPLLAAYVLLLAAFAALAWPRLRHEPVAAPA